MSLFTGPQPVGYILALVLFGCLVVAWVCVIEWRRPVDRMSDHWLDKHPEDR